jgi:hypothetical protein
MKVELLHIANCPNREVARRLVAEVLGEFELCDNISEVEERPDAGGAAMLSRVSHDSG